MKAKVRPYLELLVFGAAVVCSLGLNIPPPPTAHVMDYVGLLSEPERDQLEHTLRELERRTRAQMVVAFFSTLEGEDIGHFSFRLANAWGIGGKGIGGGLLVVFTHDRQLHLGFGRGLESTISNADAQNIIETLIVPRFRVGEYVAGVDAAARDVLYRIEAVQRSGKLRSGARRRYQSPSGQEPSSRLPTQMKEFPNV